MTLIKADTFDVLACSEPECDWSTEDVSRGKASTKARKHFEESGHDEFDQLQRKRYREVGR